MVRRPDVQSRSQPHRQEELRTQASHAPAWVLLHPPSSKYRPWSHRTPLQRLVSCYTEEGEEEEGSTEGMRSGSSHGGEETMMDAVSQLLSRALHFVEMADQAAAGGRQGEEVKIDR